MKLFVHFVGDYNVQGIPPLTVIMKKISYLNTQNLLNIDFSIILPHLPSGSSHSGLLSKICVPFIFTTSMLHATYVLFLSL